ncbi:hypothetical protein T190611E02C_40318 [Tenacibaculum sp. 190524A05c]|uniref:hypothetical protein n=1 Tax=Tenacibaculum platacis TaxID=3137852 RepID=UPI0031FA6722
MRIYFETIGIVLTVFAFAYLFMGVCAGTHDYTTWNFDTRYWFGFVGGFIPMVAGIAYVGFRKIEKQ